ncbi:MAG: 50S ribosomal protein L11 [Candidatus Nanoarchaeia archaeon]
MNIKLLVEGGNMKPGPAVAQQLGPMGINMGKVISEVNESTKDFKGMNVPVNLDVDPKTKEFSIKVLSPPTSELLKKELGIEKASGERFKTKVGNLAIEQVISVSKTKHQNMLARDFISALKSVIGTCISMGILIESKDPKDFLEEIKQGAYKEEIEQQKTQPDAEKKKQLDEYFEQIKEKQEVEKKKEEEEAAQEEAKESAEAKPAEQATEEKK